MRKLNHLAIIPDGNRRWANKHGKSLEEVYLLGCYKMLDLARHVFDEHNNIHEVSLFFVSLENIKYRKAVDLDPLFKAGLTFLDDFFNFAKSSGINLKWIGTEANNFTIDSDLYYDLVDKINSLPVYENMDRNLNVLFGHDVEEEINSIVSKFGNFSYDYLSVKSNVDLIIRSGYEHRFSGFLPLSTRYSELIVLNKLFPDVTYSDIQQAMNDYTSLKKNFGK